MADEGARLPEDHPLMAAHLRSCPECAEDYRWLLASLAALRGEQPSLAEAAPATPAFDLSFARGRAPGMAAGADGGARGKEGFEEKSGAILPGRGRRSERALRPDPERDDAIPDWRARLAAMLAGIRGILDGRWAQQASRGALAGLAFIVLGLFTWLLVFDPQLPSPIDTLRPSKRGTETKASPDVSATQTMAVLMGVDWVDSAGRPQSAGTGTPQTPRPGTARGTVSPTARGSRSGTTTALPSREDKNAERREREGGATQAPAPAGLRGSSPVTATLRSGTIIAYPPPVRATDGPGYPGPEDPDPPSGASPTPGSAPTSKPGESSATPAPPPATKPPSPAPEPGPQPSETPGAAQGDPERP
jgi:hypothetical protein